ncbi:AMP-binding protein [Kineosporia sp. A_224]|uniref:AMP-binding protein n=1 Tax=Kineosporia sp. A_224 TaxID=1962180 RepID=UPI000B4AC10C|nr:AMP-binding protein [Kineosporia sp. A_224]
MPVAFAERLDRFGDRPALVVPAPDGGADPAASVTVSYTDLARLAGAARRALGGTRRLVLLEPVPTLDCVVTYLGALAGGHVVLLCPDGATAARERLVEQYDPDVVARRAAQGAGPVWTVEERRPGTAHTLHPDLALLLGTSGSAGSPKLVRLGADGVAANAGSVADSLGITADDRAVTTLPLAYCYGLSVLHSHLARGASLVLSERSVLDEPFWRTVAEHRVTNLAGVPYTFDLLERAGFADRHCPALRLVTQAGGRMAPDRVREVAALGRRHGWDLVVMYGQTEATARMACMPAGLAARYPQAVGRAVPGGTLRVLARGTGQGPDDAPEAAPGEVGEIVYEGPNVMLGYAHGPADLALGRTTTRLRTGDLGRVGPDGLLQVTGRTSGFVKVLGVRIDLARVDENLADLGLTALADGADDRLDVAVEGCAHPAMVRSLLASELALPPSAVRVVGVDALPRTPNGKPDRAAVGRLVEAAAAPAGCCAADDAARACTAACGSRARTAAATADAGDGDGDGDVVTAPDRTARLVALYAEMLDRPDAGPASTFTGLGGDSLSYVALSVRLEDELGTPPDGWATTAVADLARSAAPRRSAWARVETAVLLRCLAIVAVVGTHANLFTLRGGAHLLLAVAGYNAARFTFTATGAGEHLRRVGRTLSRVVVPTVVWVGGLAVVGVYPWTTALLVNGPLGPDDWGRAWHYWFVEALVWILVATAALLAVPAVRRARAGHPFAVAVGLVGVGLLPRFDVVRVDTGPERGTPQYVFWLFALGWATAEARTVRQRLIVSGAAAVAVPGFFDNPARDAVVLVGVLALLWVPAVRLPRVVTPLVGILASSSLYIYLTQWQVFPALRDVPALALAASLLVGVAAWTLAERLRRVLPSPRPVDPHPLTVPARTPDPARRTS